MKEYMIKMKSTPTLTSGSSLLKPLKTFVSHDILNITKAPNEGVILSPESDSFFPLGII